MYYKICKRIIILKKKGEKQYLEKYNVKRKNLVIIAIKDAGNCTKIL